MTWCKLAPALATFLSILAPVVSQAETLSCAAAADVAEASTGVPAGLLLAIGVVESGRSDGSGTRVPWPFAIQSGGVGRFPTNSVDAVSIVRALQTAGTQSIDVGCFQINLLHHPNAFIDLAAGFDPLTNAMAAARFLVSLYGQLGAWEAAVAAYHSRTNSIGIPYRDRVLASWRGVLPDRRPRPAIAGLRLWGPDGEIGAAPSPAVPGLVAMSASYQLGVYPSGAYPVGAAAGSWIRMPRTLTASR